MKDIEPDSLTKILIPLRAGKEKLPLWGNSQAINTSGVFMNKDIRLSVGFWQHPKTKKTIKRLGLEGVRSLQILWLWASQNRPDGKLYGMDAEDIELASDWQGDEGAFWEICASLWLDKTNDGYAIHDWEDHNPWQAEAKARSEQGKKAAQVRWGNGKAKKEQCRSDADAILEHENSNAPLLSFPEEDSSLRSESLSSATAGDDDEALESGFPPCPQQQIIALYHEMLPELPRVKRWEGQRPIRLRARWRECLIARKKQGKTYDTSAGMDWWRSFFAQVRASPFLLGKKPINGKSFFANLEWLLNPEKHMNVIEGKYLDRDRRDYAPAASYAANA